MRFPVWVGVTLVVVFSFGALSGCGDDHRGKRRNPAPDPDGREVNNDLGSCSGVSLDFYDPNLSLHDASDEDYFCFSIVSDSFVVITVDFTHDDGDVDLELLDGFGFTIATSDSSSQNVELITRGLVTGNYVVRVFSKTMETNIYSLEITAQTTSGPLLPDRFEPNDTQATCTQISSDIVADSPYFASGLTIHDPTDKDYYCFTLLDVATVDIRISFFDSLGNLDMELLDSSQTLLVASTTFTDDENINVVLPPNRYAIHVFPKYPNPTFGDKNLYSLTVTATIGGGPGPDAYEPNNSPGFCAPVGDLAPTPPIPSLPTWEPLPGPLTIHTIVDEDYFCFTLGKDAGVRIDTTFTHATGNLDLQLLDAATLGIVTFSNSFTDDESLSGSLVAGDYLIHIFGVGTAINVYDLAVYVFQPDVLEPNEDPTTCSLIPSTTYVQTGLTIHQSFDEDWLCFTLPARGTDWNVTVDILFQHSIGDLTLEVYDDQLNLISFSNSLTDNEQIMALLPPGDYFIRCFGFGGSINLYDLSLLAI